MASEFPRVVAKADYAARSHEELTFKSGQLMIVLDMLSDDWYQGELDGVIGLIPTAYVDHALNWRQMQSATDSSDALALRALKEHTHHITQPNSVASTPMASPPELQMTEEEKRNARIQKYGGVPMSGFNNNIFKPSNSERNFNPGASDDELIKGKRISMRPDAPDLAKALHVRNQAAKVGGPTKNNGPSELNRHMHSIKMKSQYQERGLTNQEKELKQKLEQQTTKLALANAQRPKTELQMRMSQLAKTRPSTDSLPFGGRNN